MDVTEDDDPLNLQGLLARLFAKEPSEEAHKVIERRLTTARGLWHGDDTDAQVACELLDAFEALLRTATTHGAISQMLHRSMRKVVSEAMDAVDLITQIGIVRATAQGKPTPDEPEWLMRNEKGET